VLFALIFHEKNGILHSIKGDFMKRFFAVTVFVAVLGIFGFVACGGNDEKNWDKFLSGDITISPTTATTGTELTADYSGTEKVKFQWNKDGTAIGGKTSQKFTPAEAGSYTVTVSLSGYEKKTSTAVTVTAIIDLTGNITISPNTDVFVNTELTANYSGSEKVNYQWNKDGTSIGGKTAQKFTPTEAGSYTVTVSLAGYKSKTSAAVVVTVKRNFTITITKTVDGEEIEVATIPIIDTRTGADDENLDELGIIETLRGGLDIVKALSSFNTVISVV
jgi:hypothetical protein